MFRFLGDVALGASTAWRLDHSRVSVVANIEGPVVAVPTEAHGWTHPYSTREALATFFGDALAVASVANNHAADLGAAGLAASVAHLESLGGVVIGTPLDGRPPVTMVEHEGLRVAFIARVADESFGTAEKAERAAPLVFPLRDDEVLSAVRTAGAVADRVVVLLHWGQEWLRAPSPARVALARALADAGAHLVLGHHAHVVEAWERRGSSLVAYGLGTVELRFPDAPQVERTKPRDGRPRAWWAACSLMVDWEPRTNGTAVRALRWRHDRCVVGAPASPARVHARYLQTPTVEAYRALSRRDYWTAKLRTAWQQRILPRPSHLRSLGGIAREAQRASRAG